MWANGPTSTFYFNQLYTVVCINVPSQSKSNVETVVPFNSEDTAGALNSEADVHVKNTRQITAKRVLTSQIRL